jgi:glycine/D-amino acid oxidase-like deaminating enzyme
VVIGGGILGAIVGHQAAKLGLETIIYRLGDLFRPEADSLRNHGWLQSGLLYAHDEPEVAAAMRWSGRLMLREYGLEPPAARGVFRVSNEADAEALLEGAKRLRLSGLVERMSDAEIRRDLGPFYVPNRPCFRVPDAPFDQALLLRRVRRAGVRQRAVFRDVVQPISLRPIGGNKGRFIVVTPDGEHEPDVTVLATGCGTPKILEPLGIAPPLKVVRSPLLNMRAGDLLKDVPLFVDRSSQLATVRHPSVSWGGNVLVVGNRSRPQVPSLGPMPRQITRLEEQKLLELLPPQIRPTAGAYRTTAGFKTESLDNQRESTIKPWVYTPPEWPGLIVAVPGKATMSLATADRVLSTVVELIGKRSSKSGLPSLTSSWVDDVRMHFDYPDLDERTP